MDGDLALMIRPSMLIDLPTYEGIPHHVTTPVLLALRFKVRVLFQDGVFVSLLKNTKYI